MERDYLFTFWWSCFGLPRSSKGLVTRICSWHTRFCFSSSVRCEITVSLSRLSGWKMGSQKMGRTAGRTACFRVGLWRLRVDGYLLSSFHLHGFSYWLVWSLNVLPWSRKDWWDKDGTIKRERTQMRKDSCALVWLLNVPIARIIHTKLLLVLFLGIVFDKLASLVGERSAKSCFLSFWLHKWCDLTTNSMTQSDFSCFPARLPVPEWIEFTEALQFCFCVPRLPRIGS